jgi:hypothetical protein
MISRNNEKQGKTTDYMLRPKSINNFQGSSAYNLYSHKPKSNLFTSKDRRRRSAAAGGVSLKHNM